MYEAILRSSNRPFKATPDIEFYYPATSSEEARQTAVRAVERAEGPVAIMGAAGLGKSMLSEVIANDLCAHFDIIQLHATKLCSRKALLQNILHELDQPYRDMNEGELQLAIMDQLEPSDQRAPGGLAIIVDEAHTLPSKLLEELRLLTNFTRDHQPRARLVLLAGLRLEETLSSPELDSFNQRLAARCYLTPMDRTDTQAFVESQITRAGLHPREFITQDGIQSVYAASEGVPRIANQVLDHAIVLAATSGQCPISASLIEEAWADLQQLPVPWQLLTTREQIVDSSVNSPLESSTANETQSTQQLESIQATQANTVETSNVEFGPLEDDLPTEQAEYSFQPVPTDGIDDQVEDREDEAAQTVLPETNEFDAQIEQPNFFAAFSELEEGELPLRVQQQLTADLSALQSASDETSESNTLADAVDDSSEVDLELVEEVAESPDSDSETNERELTVGDVEEGYVEENRVEAEIPFVTSHAFFDATPAEEKIIALEAEAHELDSMGVWENDPPLQDERPIAAEISLHADELDATDLDETQSHCESEDELSSGTTSQAAAASTTQDITQKSSLFGDDFDEELSLEELGNQGRDFTRPLDAAFDAIPDVDAAFSESVKGLTNPSIANDIESEKQLQAEIAAESPVNIASLVSDTANETDERAADVLPGNERGEIVVGESENIQPDEVLPSQTDGYTLQTWDTSSYITTSNISTIRVEPVSRDEQQPDPQQLDAPQLLSQHSDAASPGDEFASKAIDVTSVDVDRELELHNEIEDLVDQLNFSGTDFRDTVEQIDIEQNANRNSSQRPDDAVRQGADDQVYTMHSAVEYPKQESLFSAADEMDDDRDLLIVEEEIAVQPPAANVKPQKTTRKLPYGQLFSRLRK